MPRTQTFVVFISIVLAVYSLFQLYVWLSYFRWTRRAKHEGDRHRWQRGGVWAIIAGNVFFFGTAFSRPLGLSSIPLLRSAVAYAAGFYLASLVLAFLILIIRDAIRLPYHVLRRGVELLKRLALSDSTTIPARRPEIDEGRRKFLKVAGVSAIGVSIATPVVLSLASVRDYKINRVTLRFPNLPGGLRGLRIAQVSDLHAGPFMTADHLVEIFDLTNSLSAHITLVTGDFVDSTDDEIGSVYDSIGTLKADLGVWGCLGNHDHFATAEKVNAALVRRNVRMLNNEHRTVAVNGDSFELIGVDDYGAGWRNFADPDAAFAGLLPDSFKILMTHRPDFFDIARKAGIDLSLAGHTHGGQVGFDIGPVKLNPVYLVHKYPMGHFMVEGKQLYVNVGVGMVGAAIRLVRPELTLFTLEPT